MLAGDRGQHQRQIEWLEQAVELGRKTPGTESLQVDALRDLGVAYGRLGDLERKISLTQEALRLAEGQPNSARKQAEVLQNLGSAYCESGLSQRSVDTTLRALELYQSLPDTARQQASCLQNLGAAYGDLGDAAGELQAYQKALALYQSVPGTVLEQASCHSNLGIALLRAGRNEEALNSLRQSETSLREMARTLTAAGATWLPEDLYKVEAGLGEVLRRRGQPGDYYASYRHFARAVNLIEQLRTRAATTPALRAGHFGQRSWVYDQLLELLLKMRHSGLPLVPQELGEKEPSFWTGFGLPVPSLWQGWSSYEEAILHFSESARARVLGDCLLAFAALSPDARAQSPWTELADLTDREALLTSRLLSTPGAPAQQLALRTELQEVSARRRSAEMAWSDTLFTRPLAPHLITLDGLRRSLPTSAALLELKLLRGRLLAILVTRDGLSLRETPTLSAGAGDELFTGHVRELVGQQVLGRLHQARLRAGQAAGLPPDTEGLLTPQELAAQFTLEELVWLLRQPMEALGKGTEAQRTEALTWQDQHLRVAAALYDLTLRPVEDELQQTGAATVAVVPDGPLCYLPFGALVTTFAPEVDEAPAGRVFAAPSVQFAAERWAFHVLPSVTVYQMLQEAWATRPAPSPNLCAFADPVLTLADARARTRDRPIPTPKVLAFSPASLDPLPPLPGTRLEAQ
ncbi:CHAT domain-containing tetratricopeptide repeat protein, partial [bacterium]|nr:CHAT domain-containing tetratricopeptide repeat protein [bacterium]